MQTFLPYPDFKESASVLDRARLGKQRVEVLQLLNVLLGKSKGNGWRNHPAAQMWKGHEGALARYGLTICQEWTSRGYKDTCAGKIDILLNEVPYDNESRFVNPPWLNDERFTSSHKANLLRKDPVWYGKFGWVEDISIPYFWPSKEGYNG